MNLSIFLICYLLLTKVHPLPNIASSHIDEWPLGTTFQPANSVELLYTLTAESFIDCATSCNVNVQCRTVVYDLISKQCTLYEGAVSTGTVLSNSGTTKVGSIEYSSDLYNCYDKINNQCSFDRYLVADTSSNVGICPINTYWNGAMCVNQLYFGAPCTSDVMCRTDLFLACDSMVNQTCGGAYEVNLVKNGDAETGSCAESTDRIAPVFWSSTGPITQLTYNNPPGPMTPTSPGPSDRGNCYFWGGSTAYDDMYQIISLDQYSFAIDQNKASYNFSAWLGGWESQDDCASLWVNFYAINNVTLGNVTIAPVYAADRLNISELLYRQMTGMVPINTRSIKIYVGMTRYAGADDDGSVDNIAFKLQYIL